VSTYSAVLVDVSAATARRDTVARTNVPAVTRARDTRCRRLVTSVRSAGGARETHLPFVRVAKENR
jgi:hypothetical protein